MSLAGTNPAGAAPSMEVTNATIANIYDGDLHKRHIHHDSDELESQGRKGSVVNVEKGEIYRYKSHTSNEDGEDGEVVLLSTTDPWDEDEAGLRETQQFTFRAVFVGCCLGGVIGASNMYLGLKTGWNFGASFFGSIFGYAIIKSSSKVLPEKFGGSYFGPKENTVLMSTATAAGSLGLIFTSGIPALYQLGLMGDGNPQKDFGKLTTFTICCAFYGLFFAVPLRKFYILKQKLVFPSSVAVAHTIRSLHTGKNAEANARKKTKALAYAFLFAICLRVGSEYAPGIFWDWHFGWTFYRLGWNGMIGAENWNWVYEWTPAFTGVGMLVGRQGSYSFVGGAILCWGIIGPAITAAGLAVVLYLAPTQYPDYYTVNSMDLSDPIHAPSPRYWLIWPGTLLLLAASFAELAANYKMIWLSLALAAEPITRRLRRRPSEEITVIDDPMPPEQQVPMWMWGSGVFLSALLSCIVLGAYWKQNVGVTIIGIIFAFIFAFIGAESGGRVSIIPVTSIGNASQLIIGGITKPHYSVQSAQIQNCMGGLLALGASYSSVEMLGDLKVAHLLRSSPRANLYGQAIGSIVAIFMSVGMYVVFSAAYPCINDLSLAASCPFPAPDVSAWRAIAVAVTDPTFPVPPTAGWTAIALAILAVIVTVAKYNFIPQNKWWTIPNFIAIGIAFILPATTYPLAMGVGATIAWYWQKRYPASHAMYCYPVAAGFIAGEGLGGIVTAILQIAGVSGQFHGSTVGCPANVYCG